MFLLNFTVISIYTRFNCIVCVSQKSVCDFTDSAVCLTLSLRCSNSTKRIERTPTDRPTYISYSWFSLLHVNFLSLILPSVSFTHAVIRSLLSTHIRCLLLVFSRSLWFVCFFLYGELDVRRWNVFVCESVCLYACVWKTPLHFHLRCSAALTRRINTYEIRFSSGKSQSHNTHRHIHHIGVWIRFKHQYRFVVVCICVCV